MFLISFGQLQRIQLSQTVAFYAHDLPLIFFNFFQLIKLLKRLKAHTIQTAIKQFARDWKWLFFFFGWGLLGLILNQQLVNFSLLPWLYWIRLITYLFFGWGVGQIIADLKKCNQWLRLLLLIITINFLWLGFGQYLLIPDLRFLGGAGWDVHYYRWTGIMLDPNFSGMIIVNFFIALWFKLKLSCKSKLGMGLVLVVALALTYSRSSYLAFIVVVCLALLPTNNKRQFAKRGLLILTIIFLIQLPFLPRPGGLGVKLERTETISSRVEVNETVLSQLTWWQWLVGKGLFVPTVNTSNTTSIVHARFPDNLLVFTLSATGIPGLVLGVIFITSYLKKMHHSNLGNYLLLSGTLVHSMFNLTILEPINLLLFLFLTQLNFSPRKTQTKKTDKINQ
jgi:hypothetical protein